ncbi:recombinase family protein [Streptomyces sp. NBC_01446]|nr:recombinase family protein [Streptomyces sp. NBC_01446]
MATHAGVYARQSERRKNGSEVSTGDQLHHGIERARQLGAVRIATYEDVGVSAYSGVERKDWERLMADCREGRINVLIVYYISRLSRLEVMDAIPIVTELLNKGVKIISITEGEFVRDNIMDLIHLIFRLHAAHQDSKNKSVAVRSALATAKSLGGWTGYAPYGFETHDAVEEIKGDDGRTRAIVVRKLRPSQEEIKTGLTHIWAPVLEHMGKRVSHGAKRNPGSIAGITTSMNETLVPTRGAKSGKGERAKSQWDRNTVTRILRDPRWCGYEAEPVYSDAPKPRVTAYRIKRDEDGQPIRLWADWEAPVSTSDWWRVQEWLDGRQADKGNSKEGVLLTGMGVLYCACDRTMTNSEPGSGKARYRCNKAQRVNPVHAGVNDLIRENLDDYVANRIFALIRAAEDDEDALLVLDEVTRRYARTQENPETAGERDQVLTERAEVRQGLEDLYDERDAGGFRTDIGRRRFLKSEAGLADRLEALDRRMAELEEASTPRLPIGQWQAWDENPTGDGSWWARQTLEERREFVRLWVKRVVVRPNRVRGTPDPIHTRVEIQWNQPTEELGMVA